MLARLETQVQLHDPGYLAGHRPAFSSLTHDVPRGARSQSAPAPSIACTPPKPRPVVTRAWAFVTPEYPDSTGSLGVGRTGIVPVAVEERVGPGDDRQVGGAVSGGSRGGPGDGIGHHGTSGSQGSNGGGSAA